MTQSSPTSYQAEAKEKKKIHLLKIHIGAYQVNDEKHNACTTQIIMVNFEKTSIIQLKNCIQCNKGVNHFSKKSIFCLGDKGRGLVS